MSNKSDTTADDNRKANKKMITTQTRFVIIDKATQTTLATLPLTFPIGQTLENFERAGYEVLWTWEAVA